MSARRGRGPAAAKVEEPDALYRVFRISDGLPAYLPAGRGMPLEEAERLSGQLAVPTEVREVWRRPES
jgi:hypothetical protein